MVHRLGSAKSNVTLTIDTEILRRARIRALERGTSVNALVRDYLASLSGGRPADLGLRAFRELAETYEAGTPGQSRRWNRDELHDRSSR